LIASLAVLMIGVLGPKSVPDLSGRFLRYSGVLHWGAYPEIGMLAMLGAAAALAILLTARTWSLRAAAALLCAMFGAVLIAVNSRGALVAVAAACGWLLAVAAVRGQRRLARPLLVLACAAVLAGGFVFRDRIQHALTPESGAQTDVASNAVANRGDHWRVAGRMMAAHPFFGVGPGRFPLDYERYSGLPPQPHAHNMLLHVGAEAGLLALIPFLVLWGRLLWLTLRASGIDPEGRDAFVMHAFVAAFFIRGMTDQFLSNVHSSLRTSLLIGIGLGLADAAASAAAARRRPSPPASS
jgi:O-antigen ligase